MEVKILQNVMEANDQIAADIKKDFDSRGIYAINMMSSPGSGKTSILEKTFTQAKDQLSFGVIEGDVETTLDGGRIATHGVPVIQIRTELFGGACHLDASMVKKAWEAFPQKDGLDLLFIENVGNLVCPAGTSLGEDLNVVVLSVTEGEDKPAKYPLIFRLADVLLINKIDLLPYLDINIDNIINSALKINPNLKIIKTSVKSGEGIDEWLQLLKDKIEKKSKKTIDN